jgi:hypothetical protein
MAIAYAILNQMSAGTISLVDMNADKLQGEAKDLEQGSGFHENVRIEASTQYDVTAHSHLVIITAGAAQRPGESRLNVVERNVAIMSSIIPPVLAQSPDASICIVSNPCDVMTAVANKVAGPLDRVPASIALDSSRSWARPWGLTPVPSRDTWWASTATIMSLSGRLFVLVVFPCWNRARNLQKFIGASTDKSSTVPTM